MADTSSTYTKIETDAQGRTIQAVYSTSTGERLGGKIIGQETIIITPIEQGKPVTEASTGFVNVSGQYQPAREYLQTEVQKQAEAGQISYGTPYTLDIKPLPESGGIVTTDETATAKDIRYQYNPFTGEKIISPFTGQQLETEYGVLLRKTGVSVASEELKRLGILEPGAEEGAYIIPAAALEAAKEKKRIEETYNYTNLTPEAKIGTHIGAFFSEKGIDYSVSWIPIPKIAGWYEPKKPEEIATEVWRTRALQKESLQKAGRWEEGQWWELWKGGRSEVFMTGAIGAFEGSPPAVFGTSYLMGKAPSYLIRGGRWLAGKGGFFAKASEFLARPVSIVGFRAEPFKTTIGGMAAGGIGLGLTGAYVGGRTIEVGSAVMEKNLQKVASLGARTSLELVGLATGFKAGAKEVSLDISKLPSDIQPYWKEMAKRVEMGKKFNVPAGELRVSLSASAKEGKFPRELIEPTIEWFRVHKSDYSKIYGSQARKTQEIREWQQKVGKDIDIAVARGKSELELAKDYYEFIKSYAKKTTKLNLNREEVRWNGKILAQFHPYKSAEGWYSLKPIKTKEGIKISRMSEELGRLTNSMMQDIREMPKRGGRFTKDVASRFDVEKQFKIMKRAEIKESMPIVKQFKELQYKGFIESYAKTYKNPKKLISTYEFFGKKRIQAIPSSKAGTLKQVKTMKKKLIGESKLLRRKGTANLPYNEEAYKMPFKYPIISIPYPKGMTYPKTAYSKPFKTPSAYGTPYKSTKLAKPIYKPPYKEPKLVTPYYPPKKIFPYYPPTKYPPIKTPPGYPALTKIPILPPAKPPASRLPKNKIDEILIKGKKLKKGLWYNKRTWGVVATPEEISRAFGMRQWKGQKVKPKP
jgi:hypothetical protein